ncbi:immunity protein Imm33 domain-containing protein [Pseudoduganella lutea]|uniref:immunity protein Imm33 domain-containing protein n=1 Tax=Pseudoduganella lutea TaxID=321985 RepID=UPI001A92E0CD|nr:hypothetical protein [Pseudoduganella lutea]
MPEKIQLSPAKAKCLPRSDQLVVISDGVYEGDAVEGVRYPSPEHMSGWWLTTDRYDGDIKSLKTVHFYHIAQFRPDLNDFLGLAFGYRFFSGDGRTWFDQKVADSEP